MKEKPEGYVWVGKLPKRKSWYLYLECGTEIIALARFISCREASTFVEEPVKDGLRYGVRSWPVYNSTAVDGIDLKRL
jgi:hypothetical protein